MSTRTSPAIDRPFRRCGSIGIGHPDPDIGFAEGKFHLITQMKNDFVSPGPWVDGVSVRAGVDTTRDGKADTWTGWRAVRESYDLIEGFAKQIAKTPAALDLSGLPAGYGLQFEIRTRDVGGNVVRPVIDRVEVGF